MPALRPRRRGCMGDRLRSGDRGRYHDNLWRVRDGLSGIEALHCDILNIPTSERKRSAMSDEQTEGWIRVIRSGKPKRLRSLAAPTGSAQWCEHIERDYGLQGQQWRMAGGDWHAIPRTWIFCPFCGNRKPKLPMGRPNAELRHGAKTPMYEH